MTLVGQQPGRKGLAHGNTAVTITRDRYHRFDALKIQVQQIVIAQPFGHRYLAIENEIRLFRIDEMFRANTERQRLTRFDLTAIHRDPHGTPARHLDLNGILIGTQRANRQKIHLW